MKIYPLLDNNNILNEVRKLEWKRKIPGGWLKYGPPREVCAYGDGSLYTEKGKKYGPKYKETAWAGAIPLNKSTLVVKTQPLPKDLMKTTLMKQLRDCLKVYGAEVDDSSCTGMWCNYYNQETDNIAPHKDDENYYQRNYKKQPLFVSLTLYEDNSDSLKNLARFQIKEEGKWKSIDLPHKSLLVMSGDIEHRVVKPKKNKFRKRYKIPYKVYLPKNYEEKYNEILESFKHLVKLKIYYNQDIDRSEILKSLDVKTRAPSTTTNMALCVLYNNLN